MRVVLPKQSSIPPSLPTYLPSINQSKQGNTDIIGLILIKTIPHPRLLPLLHLLPPQGQSPKGAVSRGAEGGDLRSEGVEGGRESGEGGGVEGRGGGEEGEGEGEGKEEGGAKEGEEEEGG